MEITINRRKKTAFTEYNRLYNKYGRIFITTPELARELGVEKNKIEYPIMKKEFPIKHVKAKAHCFMIWDVAQYLIDGKVDNRLGKNIEKYIFSQLKNMDNKNKRKEKKG